MNTNEKLPVGTGSWKRKLGFGCLGIVGLAFACGIMATVFNAIDGNSDDDLVAADEQPTMTATPTSEPETVMITDDHIDETIAFMDDEPQVNDTTITVDDDTVIIAVQVEHAPNEERAREILDSAVRWLASQAAMSSDVIDSPSADTLGGIWDHYTLQVAAGPDAETFYARGAKATNSPHISWD